MDRAVGQWLRASRLHAPLAERTVLELARVIQSWQRHPQGADQAPKALRRRGLRARDRLVRHNLALVAHIWRSYHPTLSAEESSTADALQEGALNLVRAAEKFDPAKGYRFSTYASFWIRRGLHQFEQRCRRTIHFPADKAELVLRAQKLWETYRQAQGSEPSLQWLASQLSSPRLPVTGAGLQQLITLWHGTLTCALV
jgi:RNA polymerase sigma factor (sigma-70 family)